VAPGCAPRSRRAADPNHDPERDTEPHWEDYRVLVHGTDRILDALHTVKWEQDGTLTFRRSCAHGICGSDAVRINGRNRLACKTLVKDLNPRRPITIEPIKGLPVEKDLVVDSRDEGGEQRLETLNDREGVWRCRTTFTCTEACPRAIEVTGRSRRSSAP